MLKKTAFFLLCFLRIHASIFDLFSSLSAQAQRAQEVLGDIDRLVAQSLCDYNVPGVSIGVVVDGHLIYAKGFGVRELESQSPITPDTIFPIGSCTKAFTSFLVGTFVDEGLVNWDQRILDLYPEFRLKDLYATQTITMRDLLTHRSGMPRHDFMWYNSAMSRSEVMSRLRYLDPSCELRERYQYNNLMYLTAGYVLEQLSEKSWEELVRERILTPLGMKHTNFSPVDLLKESNIARPHVEKSGKLKEIPFRDFTAVGPGASMNSNVNDLAKWVTMLLDGGVYNQRPLISPATLQEIEAPQVIVSGAPETKETHISTYGMGWNISAYRGNYLVSHDAGPDGATSVVAILPKSRVGVIVLANRNLTVLPRFLSLILIDRILELPSIDWMKDGIEGTIKNRETVNQEITNESLFRKKGTTPSHPLEEYIGEYIHPGYGEVTVALVDGKLQATFNDITSTLDHWHYDVFSIAEESLDMIVTRVGTKLNFSSNINGDVEELRIPFEPNTDDIVFRKTNPDCLPLGYLRQFTGFYEIYGYTVEVAVRNQALCAMIPGQPLFELVPLGQNEFTVKAMTGYSIRFVVREDGTVDEVLLIQPYGTLVARPKGAMG